MSDGVTIERSFYFKPFHKKARAKVTMFRRRAQVLDFAGREGIKEIQREIRRSSWKRPPTRLLKSWSYKVEGNTVRIISTHPASKIGRTYAPLDEGVKAGPMNTSIPRLRVPIILDDGRLIFRNMTANTASLTL